MESKQGDPIDNNFFEENIDKLTIFNSDPYLKFFRGHFEYRNKVFYGRLKWIHQNEGNLVNFAKTAENYGVLPRPDGIWIKEWLPGAKEVYIFGEFTNWERKKYQLKKDDFGNFTLFIPKNEKGEYVIPHNSKIKLHILNAQDQWTDRIPAYIRKVIQNEHDKTYDGIFWNPPSKYQFKHPVPKKPKNLKIYETHIGMAGVDPCVHTFKEFTQNVLPRIKKLGYNCIQIMALMEHAYYGSFGYHVTNFYAPSSRFGTPDDLRELVDTAHGFGIYVLMDLVHSHASANAQDGINLLDGTDYQFFHSGAKGRHELWDSQLFDYSKYEVLRFLLGNLHMWTDEFRFDGFRFDGITSMMYVHHGIGYGFSGDYNEYFTELTDIDAVVYLMLANSLIHQQNPNAITIAEDVSGMPGLGYSIKSGGVGFDYRLAMAIPDKWIKFLKEYGDDQWDIGNLTFTLINRRFDENVIAYCESHDQAIVGDKTIAMWLFDKEMYFEMACDKPETLIIARGMALHKMIRLLTCGLGGDGYLTFMGNEFGHPEWIDFPRLGNNWSYHHCRRRFDLAEANHLRYKFLDAWDEAMIHCEEDNQWLASKDNYVSLQHQDDKLIVFERMNLVFVFNFHPTKSFEHYRVGVRYASDHKIILDSDEARFGGYERLRHGHDHPFPVVKEGWHNRPNHLVLYIPCRTCMILKAL